MDGATSGLGASSRRIASGPHLFKLADVNADLPPAEHQRPLALDGRQFQEFRW